MTMFIGRQAMSLCTTGKGFLTSGALLVKKDKPRKCPLKQTCILYPLLHYKLMQNVTPFHISYNQ